MPLSVLSLRQSLALPAALALGLFFCGLPSPARGQAVDPTKAKIPPFEDIDLKDKNGLPLTKDRLLIKATFYPGLQKEKTVPIIMLHGAKGNRTEYAALATFLQEQHGHAVLVPDLRGHGDSIKFANSTKTVDASKLKPEDYDMMVADVEACKKFLIQKNNAKELNIEKLCVIGSEMGAVVAMNWAVTDWAWPPLAGVKQGQDVKALVLLSPQFQVVGGRLNMTAPLKEEMIQKQFSVALLYGSVNSRKAGQDAERLQTSLSRFHIGNEPTFYFEEMKTSLQGIKMLAAPGLPVMDLIATFIKLRLVEKDFPWKERVGPLN